MNNTPKSLHGRCATCFYWEGDKVKAAETFKDNPVSMDAKDGWPEDGGCAIEYDWLNTEMYGDARVTQTVDANFGCVYHSADEDIVEV